MREKELRLVVTFHTTADAMAMEKACREHDVPGRLIPVPALHLRRVRPGMVRAACREGEALRGHGRAGDRPGRTARVSGVRIARDKHKTLSHL